MLYFLLGNSHVLAHGLGRGTDPGEVNCDISCRYGLFNARIFDLHWEIPTDSWGVKVSKYCMCTRAVCIKELIL